MRKNLIFVVRVKTVLCEPSWPHGTPQGGVLSPFTSDSNHHGDRMSPSGVPCDQGRSYNIVLTFTTKQWDTFFSHEANCIPVFYFIVPLLRHEFVRMLCGHLLTVITGISQHVPRGAAHPGRVSLTSKELDPHFSQLLSRSILDNLLCACVYCRNNRIVTFNEMLYFDDLQTYCMYNTIF